MNFKDKVIRLIDIEMQDMINDLGGDPDTQYGGMVDCDEFASYSKYKLLQGLKEDILHLSSDD